MSKRDWKLFLMDILECIKKIEKYTTGLSYDEFLNDSKTLDAVIRNLEIIGEAANKVPKYVQQKYKEIPWAQIVSLRNRLVHAYFVIDYEIVWHIVTTELFNLKNKIELILKKETKDD